MTNDEKPTRLPTIGITMGDPLGIGAEVIMKALADHSLRERANFVIYGLAEQLESAADLAELQSFWKISPRGLENGNGRCNVRILDFDEFAVHRRRPAQATSEGGRASMAFLEDAMRDARYEQIDAIVTGPINKTSWKLAGFDKVPGHTELLADKFHARRVTMMFVGGPLRVALASTHEALFELRHRFTIGHVYQPIDLMHQALTEWFGFLRPRIAVAGLNPHASENGRFGDEEARIIEPAIDMARNHGIEATGPFPADTLFRRAAQGEFDGVVAMYHDQALIPVKLLAFDEAVNITLGLPIIRTSVDHGTAFDIVDRNRADPGSMKAAIRLAIELAVQRRAKQLREAAEADSSPSQDPRS